MPIQISFTPKNTLRANDKGKVFVYFPRWNPDEGTFAQHSISNPVCKSISGMSSMLSCTYSTETQSLTITNPVSSDTAGILLTFEVSNFRNPYNGKSKTGYYVMTTDEQNGEIDSSQGFIEMSIKVTDWASFKLVNLYRSDGETTVGSLSEMGFLIRVGLPVDAGCRLKITFPTDMPLTNDLQYVSAPSITSSSSPSLSVSSNFFTISGCASY